MSIIYVLFSSLEASIVFYIVTCKFAMLNGARVMAGTLDMVLHILTVSFHVKPFEDPVLIYTTTFVLAMSSGTRITCRDSLHWT